MENLSATAQLLCELISRASITPEDAGCQLIIAQRLENMGFETHTIHSNGVMNLYAQRGTSHPILAFAGHTDVVPSGPIDHWQSPPFTPQLRDGKIYGRGAADMKSGIAAMITAVERFLQKNPNHNESFAFLITSDEEGDALDGTLKIMEYLQQEQIALDACIVGEPTSSKKLGDTIKIGRRGSLSGKLTIIGKQGHVAYPQQAINPIHQLASAIDLLSAVTWDHGNDDFPATSLQFSNIMGGTGVDNVIPEQASAQFNFRYSTIQTDEGLKKQVEQQLAPLNLNFTITWGHTDHPFLTKTGTFINACQQAIADVMNYQPILSTSGGTSDGRYIAPTGTHVVEIGPSNETIHSIDECIDLESLENLSLIYEKILEIVQVKIEKQVDSKIIV